MTQVKVFCDVCSDLITADRTNLVVKCGPERQRGRHEIDLCGGCLPKLTSLLDDRRENCTAPVPRRQPKASLSAQTL